MGNSIFDNDQAKRSNHEAGAQASVGVSGAKEKKERFNISLYPSTRDKLNAKADEMRISASHLLEILIREHC